jgi:hypothetical protein
MKAESLVKWLQNLSTSEVNVEDDSIEEIALGISHWS